MAAADEADAGQKINDAVCIFIYLIEVVVGAVASVVIIFMGLKYLTSGDDPHARYMARTGIIAAFTGIIIVAIAVPVVNIFASSLMGTVDCGYFPDLSGVNGAQEVSTAPAKADASGSAEKSADIVAKGLFLTKSLGYIKAEGYNEFC